MHTNPRGPAPPTRLHGRFRPSPASSCPAGCAQGPAHGRFSRWRPRRSHFGIHRFLFLLIAGLVGFGTAEAGKIPFPFVLQTGRRGAERDPFRDPDAAPDAPRPAGLAGLGVTETVIRGIVHRRVPTDGEDETNPSAWAILESPSGEGFVAAPGDRLFDGVLGLIEDGGVVFWLDGDPDRRVYRPLARSATGAEEGA